MKGKDFIEMMHQDIATLKPEEMDKMVAVVYCMEEVVENNPNCEIEEGKEPKTAQKCYKMLEDYARKNNLNCIATKKSLELVAEYLGLKASKEEPKAKTTAKVNLEDFL